uniref:Uncharacterized protein n=1 Tax=Hyaloperonospora arabidopsidis (strain Emoy2) TaxID=559515 RepID=M4BQ49_HYAAE
MVCARVSSNESRGSSSTGNLNRTSSICKRLRLGSPSPTERPRRVKLLMSVRKVECRTFESYLSVCPSVCL